ncbi:orotidine-5'-phosphate decarboxylase [Desulfotomaculum arcticum]|uniref:Orotidine 5'-phosphate decarboxylase n=1 Tax=Desulfotruncus arcticus DSM 17038 TaxID=1121424 RepID=A0A1I2XY76_9FIRM|nr:orotidine-5'-phosphate decarboxylase [Desulfotruncus arcticus]SFH18413.1 orotidine-5'-phosphate decarboxylase [Desulfotomaculum arcticum] [Desulfotruncus arcticus DSM 17038]
MSKEKLIVALDVNNRAEAMSLVKELAGVTDFFKVGMELFYSEGVGIVREIAAAGAKVFLDLKLHDIPNTVGRAARVLVRSGASIINVHAAGGGAMMRAAGDSAREEAAKLGLPAPAVVAVTVLTSIDSNAFTREMGYTGAIEDRVRTWALLARESGLDGVVCSPREIKMVRKACGPDFKIITPGIRPAGSDLNDQRRVMTPGEAIKAGASQIVIGRPVTGAPDRCAAAAAILAELSGA